MGRVGGATISRKLLGFYLVAGILPLILIGLIAVRMGAEALLEKSFDQLTTVQSLRKTQIERDIAMRVESVRRLNQRNDIINLFTEIGAYRTKLNRPMTAPLPTDTDAYRAILARYSPSLGQYLATNGYRDLLLIAADHGQILYSLKGDPSLGKPLEASLLHNSGLAKLWAEVTATHNTAFVDFAPYEDGSGSYAAFIGQPYFDHDGKLTGVIAMRLGPELIDSIVASRDGMGDTGESYIVSFDRATAHYEFRTTVRTTGAGRYAMGVVMTTPLPYWEVARDRGEAGGIGQYVDSADNQVLVAFNRLALGDDGVEWYLVSKIDRTEVLAPVRALTFNMLALGICLIVFVTVGALLFASSFTRPILRATEFAKAIASGRFDVEISDRRNDELGTLVDSLGTMAHRLRDLDWIKTGTETLDDALRGEHDPNRLADSFLTHIVKHLGASLGAVYIRRESTPAFALAARHAMTDRDGDRLEEVPFGDGMIGQAAYEDAPLYFSTTPEDAEAPVLDYGAGEATPSHFVSAPLLFDGDPVGVLLLGAFAPFDETKRQFLGDIAGKVGILIAAAKSHQTIQDLLRRAQAQEAELRENNAELERQTKALAESERELQTQQEELRVINEELEEQTRALRKSETELQSQQEELRVTNEELEERSQELERRSRDLQHKNEELTSARDEIRQKVRELEAASKYKSEFLANMSHELRTPLNSILILSQLLGENRTGNLTSRQIESAHTINAAGSDLLKLINDILDLSKVEAGKLELMIEPTPLAGFVADVERVFRDLAENKGIGFDVTVAENAPPVITTDPHRLQQVVRNLLSNAFKFTDAGGKVAFAVTRADAAAIPAESGLSPDDAIVVTVKDNGIGIPLDRQADIFEAFQQGDGGTSRKYGGTGLGLSITRRLTEALGGVITLTSEPGKGSEFRLFLPTVCPPQAKAAPSLPERAKKAAAAERTALAAAAETAAAKAAPPAKTAETEAAKKPPAWTELPSDEVADDRKSLAPGDRILLIVEDDPEFAEILRDLARERHYKCLVATDGETGLHFADYYRPSAIILDVGLPGIDGWAVMSRLKDNPETRHIPVHFISGTEQTLDALRMGAVGFLTKPVSLERLEEAFTKIEDVISKPVSSLLVVEDDPVQSDAIRQLIGDGDVLTTVAASGAAALEALAAKSFDCMILDLGLHDISGFELLERMRGIKACARLPVIIYTGRELTKPEEEKLKRYAESIIIKGVRSPERLLDETSLFLHRVEASLPERQRAMIRMVHDRDAALKGKTVLLVDDDMRNVFALSSVLEDKDIKVTIARNGIECLERIKQNPDFDLVLMDIMMPEMDGYEAMRQIRKNKAHAKLPIIALTAKAMKGDRNKCIEAGANDYLAKPVDTEKLLSLLRVWLYK